MGALAARRYQRNSRVNAEEMERKVGVTQRVKARRKLKKREKQGTIFDIEFGWRKRCGHAEKRGRNFC